MTSVHSLLGPMKNTPIKEKYGYTDTSNYNPRNVTPIDKLSFIDVNPFQDTLNYERPVIEPLQITNTTNQFLDPLYTYKKQKNIRPGCTPVTDLLLPETSTMVYTDEFLNRPSERVFLQNVQPDIFSYSRDQTPINALASGISYTPQIPPKFRDQVYTLPEGLTYPIYTRIDPQLIRKDGVPARLSEQPIRSDQSTDYSSWEAAPGSVNYEDIYDARYNSYGDPYRSYSDVNLGQVKYYYSDIDAYRYPNFVSRSKVDFVEYTDPMGKVQPYYERTAGLNDTRPYVENQWMSDSNYFRENISESLMRKRNSELWQNRVAPISRSANTTCFTSGV